MERIQKGALHIILGDKYESYRNALNLTSLESLDDRRDNLCIKFAKKTERNPKFKKWFKPKPKIYTRQVDERYCKED